MNNSPSVELEIGRLLKKSLAQETAYELLKKYDWSNLNKDEFRTLFNYFLLSNQVVLIIEHLKVRIKKDMPIPWDLFFEGCYKFYDGFKETHFLVIQASAEQQNALELLAMHPEVSHFSANLERTRKDLIYLQKEKVLDKRRELFMLYDLFHSQGLIEKEQELLDRILEYFPDDPEANEKIQKLKAKKVSEYFESQLDNRRVKYFPKSITSAEENIILENITSGMIKVLMEDPHLQNDFAVALLMLDSPEHALEIIQLITSANHWLKIEVLIKCGRYLETLKIVNDLKPRFTDNPEAILALFYCQAQALWYLGQQQKAIEILEAMTADHPDFRSATALLLEWKTQLENGA